jgi:hypothetical protein
MLALVKQPRSRNPRPVTERHPMEILQENEARVEKILVPRRARLAEVVCMQATEPRSPQGIRHPLPNMTLAMLAGLWSRELFARFSAEGFGLFGNLKENKPELFTEAERARCRRGRNEGRRGKRIGSALTKPSDCTYHRTHAASR